MKNGCETRLLTEL